MIGLEAFVRLLQVHFYVGMSMITEYCGSPSEFNDISINDIEWCPQWLSYVVPSETIIEVPEITIISP